jgi:peptidoglycan hydrolase-like protein with peptidoglycan-binding domain/predicted nucleotidyltransferase
MGKFTEILKSFSLQETLNPKIWDNYDDPKDAKMKPKVRKALERIAEEFIDYLGEDVMVEDIILTGSLANYNWSSFSDFDLHVLVDLQQYEKESETYKELYDLKKRIFNDSHDIKILGYDVELYAQDKEESHVSSAVYSVANDEWINVPKKDFKKIDKNVLVNKIDNWVEKIETSIEDSETDGVEKLETIKDKLKEYRKCGLEKGGELSYENLVFKFLRRSKHIEKLFDKINELKDKELSVEQHLNEQDMKKENKEVIDIIENSVFLKKLKELADNKKTFEYTPGMKIPFDDDVRIIQDGLEFLNFKLPKWGIDGKLGSETKAAIEKFQESSGLLKDGVMKTNDLKHLLALLVLNKFSDSKLNKFTGEFGKDGNFTYLDMNDPEAFKLYAEICQNFIDKRNPDAGVDGQMMAECSKRYFSQGYVPPELALAQLALEGGLSKNQTVRPRRTKNPFNVGNTDSGKNKYFSTVQEGVCAYYDLMVRRYLTGGKKAGDLLRNFVNVNGNRYASGEYEPKLRSIVSSVSNISDMVLSKSKLGSSNLA